ncbi:unnamed protein product [Arabidopsis arenosa]|uniref:Uncharacterized protein n=1 Tax=Arabidopsis arenosa TaxID=38785 RepID=A0A8S2AM38_ARAAE|nr:unnamed protein product [Arabidopsis arenosa]
MNVTGLTAMTSWRTLFDPSPGFYSLRLSPGFNEFQLVYKGATPYWSTGNWTGEAFVGVPEMTIPYIYRFHFVNPYTPSASFWYIVPPLDAVSEPRLTRFMVGANGQLKQYTWDPQTQSWNMFWLQPEGPCRVYSLCGQLGFCSSQLLKPCACIRGFRPKNDDAWRSDDYKRRMPPVVGSISVLGITLLVPLILLKRSRKEEEDEETDEDGFAVLNLKVLSFKELQTATMSSRIRSDTVVLGRFSKEHVPGSSTFVAVKRVERPGSGESEFRAENKPQIAKLGDPFQDRVSDFNAKVSDFGLAKLLGRDFSRVLATMRGTWGYVAPEWISGLPITTKADVYSFGMTLLELIGGRRNVIVNSDTLGEKETEPEKWFFPPWAAREIIQGNVDSVVDSRLNREYNIEEMLEGVVEVTVPPPPKLIQALVSGDSYRGVSGTTCSESRGCSDLNTGLSSPGSRSSFGRPSP